MGPNPDLCNAVRETEDRLLYLSRKIATFTIILSGQLVCQVAPGPGTIGRTHKWTIGQAIGIFEFCYTIVINFYAEVMFYSSEELLFLPEPDQKNDA